jgi:hypothetical protein
MVVAHSFFCVRVLCNYYVTTGKYFSLVVYSKGFLVECHSLEGNLGGRYGTSIVPECFLRRHQLG